MKVIINRTSRNLIRLSLKASRLTTNRPSSTQVL